MRTLILAALLLPLLAGCDKPVSYYAAHPAERHARIRWCLGSGLPNDGQDCRNAALAELDAMGVKVVNGRAASPPKLSGPQARAVRWAS